MRKEAMKELPYTFKMPTSLPDLLAHTTGRSPEECGTVVERIHSCHHPSLAPENRQLLEKFLDLVVSYCRHLGREATQQDLQTLNYLASPLLALAQVSPLHAARLFRRLLSAVHKSWKSARRRLFPPFDHVVIFWLVGVVFSASDFRHPVTTPAMLIMGQILLKSSVKTVGDLVLGLTVCHIFTTLFISSSKRLVPELVNFLTSCTSLISTHPTPVVLPPFSASSKLRLALCDSVRKWQSTSPLPDISSVLSLIMAERVRGGEDREMGGDPAVSAAAVSSCLRTVQRLTQLYCDLPSFAELFSAIAFNLQQLVRKSKK
ncbi:Nucleolar protein 14 [Geodia barretti]|uniref:Nucleolar protein 14 n=1 Tax=Geodia barretti TaxID=519541 RepID=A0AA35T5S5_GEOBA|nr:Nucleolar protein 14 [Geodia barretti]